MRAFYLIFFASLVSSSWCGLIVNDLSDNIQSKLFGLHEEAKQNSPVININSQQQVTVANNHKLNGPRGDYGSLPLAHGLHHDSGLQSNFKAVGISTHYHQGVTHGFGSTITNYGKQNSMDGIAGSLLENIGNDMSSHQIIKQKSDGMKFGSHHDNNMFGNVQGVSGSSSSSLLSSLSSSSSSLFGESTTSSSSTGGSSTTSSGVFSGLGLKSWFK